MTRPEIEPRSPGPLANTLLIRPMTRYIHTYTCTYIYTCIHVYIYIYIHTCIYLYKYAYIYTYIHAYICTHTHTHTQTHTHTHIYIYIFRHLLHSSFSRIQTNYLFLSLVLPVSSSRQSQPWWLDGTIRFLPINTPKPRYWVYRQISPGVVMATWTFQHREKLFRISLPASYLQHLNGNSRSNLPHPTHLPHPNASPHPVYPTFIRHFDPFKPWNPERVPINS